MGGRGGREEGLAGQLGPRRGASATARALQHRYTHTLDTTRTRALHAGPATAAVSRPERVRAAAVSQTGRLLRRLCSAADRPTDSTTRNPCRPGELSGAPSGSAARDPAEWQRLEGGGGRRLESVRRHWRRLCGRGGRRSRRRRQRVQDAC